MVNRNGRTTEPYYLTAHEMRDLLQKREISATELTRSVLERLDVTEYRHDATA